MKALFLAVTEQLASVDAFRYIDMDKGQLDTAEIRPAVAFPCALVKSSFTFTEYHDVATNRMATVRIRIAFDPGSLRTSTATPSEQRDASLAYIDTTESVVEAFRDFETDDYSAFIIKELVQEDRRDGLVVMRMVFVTNRLDV